MKKIRELITYTYYQFKLRGKMRIFSELLPLHHSDIETIQERQIINLSKLINHAYSNIPYYKEAFKKFSDQGQITIKSLDDLQKFPLLDKEILRNQGEQMLLASHSERGSYKNTSGGSTGAPVLFTQDKWFEDRSGANFLLIKSWRTSRIFGESVYLWGANRDTRDTLKARLSDFLHNITFFNTSKLTYNQKTHIIEYLNKNRPEFILAYAQSIFELAKFAESNGLKVLPQKVIHTGAGMLYDHMREKIESVFQCKVFNHYGSREVSLIASECKAHDGLHLLSDFNYVEILNKNGRPCEDGEEGEVVVTTLHNYSMPLIRYRIGDIAIRKKYERCSCRCGYPSLEKISGRTSENFVNLAGDTISGEYLTLTYNFIEGVVNFQIVQKQRDYIRIKLIVNNEYDLVKAEEIIREKITYLFGSETRLEFIYVDEIPKTATGKHLFTVNEISL